MLTSSKSFNARVKAGQPVLISPAIVLIAFSVWAVTAGSAAAHGGATTDQSSAAVEAEPRGDVAADNASHRLGALEERVRRIEAVLAAEDKVRAERQQKLESGFWGRLDGN